MMNYADKDFWVASAIRRWDAFASTAAFPRGEIFKKTFEDIHKLLKNQKNAFSTGAQLFYESTYFGDPRLIAEVILQHAFDNTISQPSAITDNYYDFIKKLAGHMARIANNVDDPKIRTPNSYIINILSGLLGLYATAALTKAYLISAGLTSAGKLISTVLPFSGWASSFGMVFPPAVILMFAIIPLAIFLYIANNVYRSSTQSKIDMYGSAYRRQQSNFGPQFDETRQSLKEKIDPSNLTAWVRRRPEAADQEEIHAELDAFTT